jgi:hypothetical protein
VGKVREDQAHHLRNLTAERRFFRGFKVVLTLEVGEEGVDVGEEEAGVGAGEDVEGGNHA